MELVFLIERLISHYDFLSEADDRTRQYGGHVAAGVGGAALGSYINKEVKAGRLIKAKGDVKKAAAGVKSALSNSRQAWKDARSAKDTLRSTAAKTKDAINKSAAKTIYNREKRVATQLAKKEPSGFFAKLKHNAAVKDQQGRVAAARDSLKGHHSLSDLKAAGANYKNAAAKASRASSKVRQSLSTLNKANQGVKSARKLVKGAGLRGGLGGALAATGALAGARYLANRNK